MSLAKQREDVLTELPRLPHVAAKLNEALANPDISLREVSAIIETDPALSARLVRMANSPLVSAGRPVKSVMYAVALMGLAEVRHMVLALSVMNCAGPIPTAALKQWATHSMATANLAASLSRRQLATQPLGWARFAGMMHASGQLIRWRMDPKMAASIWEYQLGNPVPFSQAEEAQGAEAEGRLGAWLAWEWGLPEELAEICIGHAAPDPSIRCERVSTGHMSRVIATASATAELVMLDPPPERQQPWLERISELQANMDGPDMALWLDEARAVVSEARASARG